MILTRAMFTPRLVERLVRREDRRAVRADLAVLLLKDGDVLRQRLEQLLRVQRRHDHAAVDLHLRPPRNDPPEVDYEFAGRMNDVREVDVLPLRDGVVEGDAEGGLYLLVHGATIPWANE